MNFFFGKLHDQIFIFDHLVRDNSFPKSQFLNIDLPAEVVSDRRVAIQFIRIRII